LILFTVGRTPWTGISLSQGLEPAIHRSIKRRLFLP
jgi:hypothetical protein